MPASNDSLSAEGPASEPALSTSGAGARRPAADGCIVAWGGRASESSRRLSLADYKDTSLGRVSGASALHTPRTSHIRVALAQLERVAAVGG